jgi:hypothetical protein
MARNLTVDNLPYLDNGKAHAAINHALRQAVADIQDRPGDKSRRNVVITIEMTPKLDGNLATLDTVQTRILIDLKIPRRQTVDYPMLPTPDNRLIFQELSPMDPRQMDLMTPLNNQAQDSGAVSATGYDEDESTHNETETI